MAKLKWIVEVNADGTSKVRKVREEFKKLDENARKSAKGLSLVDKVSLGAITASLGALAKQGIDSASQIENLEKQFKPLLGSAEEAEKRIRELTEFASSTPFQLEGIAQASRTLQTLTNGVLATGDGLRLVGDASAQSGENFADLAVHVGRAYSNLTSNRSAGESLARLQELGLLSGQARNEIEELQKSAKGQEAFDVLQSELKKTSGSMEELSSTFTGRLSTLSDNWRLFTADFVEKSGVFDLAKSAVEGLNEALEFVTNKDLKGDFDDIVASNELLNEVIKEQTKLEEQARIREKERIEAEAKASADKIRNQKLILAQAKELEKQRVKDQKEAEREAERQESLRTDSLERAVAFDAEKRDLKLQALAMEMEDERNSWGERQEFLLEAQAIEKQMLDEWHRSSLDAQILTNEEKLAINSLYDSKVLAMAKSHADAQMALDDSVADHKMQTVNDYLTASQSISGALSALFEKNKGVAIAEILIQGAVAQMNALAMQPYIPVGVASQIHAGVLTGVALSQAMKAKPKNRGGMIDGSDQIYRVNEGGRQEGIINNQGLNAIGGESGLDALNNGRMDRLIDNFSSLNTGPQINVSVNGVLTQEVYDNEIKPFAERDMAFR